MDVYLKDLVKPGVVEEMQFEDKGFCSLVMFLRKAGKACKVSIRKVVGFRLLNAYSHTWKTQFPGTVSTVREIHGSWSVFIILDVYLWAH